VDRRRFLASSLAFALSACATTVNPRRTLGAVGVAGGPARRPSGGSPRQLAQWPVEAGLVTCEFGPRWGTLHSGIDITADAGVPVYAVASGQVVHAGALGTYGNLVVLRHDARRTTLYAHNDALRVRAGESVRAGQVIALLGSSGLASGPHVHFEVREGDQPVDPRRRLPAGVFWPRALTDAGGRR
jgi:murein DD-endopeptidase MepM/ murein hydrolase activator NlpD